MNLSVPQPLYQIKVLKNLALPPPSFLFAWNPALQMAAGFLGFRCGTGIRQSCCPINLNWWLKRLLCSQKNIFHV